MLLLSHYKDFTVSLMVTRDFLGPGTSFIEEHYREDISAADLSERFGLSASYISSLLKTALGVRYSDYVAGLRLNHAKELLATTHMTVKDITVECGWYSQSYFTKLFIEREGCTPVEYRKSFGK